MRSTRRAPILLATLALALTGASTTSTATAVASPTADVAATHAYIQAHYTLARASVARLVAAQVNAQRYTRKIAKQCPGAGTGSLQNEEAQQMSYEMAGALWSITFRTDAGPIGSFARTVSHLHWHNPALTRTARAYARDLSALAQLPTPDVCADVRAWKATGFTKIPPSTISFDKHVEALEPKAVPAHLLAPSTPPSDAAAARRTTHLELELEENEFEVGFDDWLALLNALGLHQ
jgi:hypothetical protein